MYAYALISLSCQFLAVLIILIGWPSKGKLKVAKYLLLFFFGLAVVSVPNFYTVVFTPFVKLAVYMFSWSDGHPEIIMAGPLVICLIPIAMFYLIALLATVVIPAMLIAAFFLTPLFFLFYPFYYLNAEKKIRMADFLVKDIDDILNLI